MDHVGGVGGGHRGPTQSPKERPLKGTRLTVAQTTRTGNEKTRGNKRRAEKAAQTAKRLMDRKVWAEDEKVREWCEPGGIETGGGTSGDRSRQQYSRICYVETSKAESQQRK